MLARACSTPESLRTRRITSIIDTRRKNDDDASAIATVIVRAAETNVLGSALMDPT
jgi:hypothetical protein